MTKHKGKKVEDYKAELEAPTQVAEVRVPKEQKREQESKMSVSPQDVAMWIEKGEYLEFGVSQALGQPTTVTIVFPN